MLVGAGTTTANTGVGLLKNELVKAYKSGGSVAEIAESWSKLNKFAKPAKILGNALGIVSGAQHFGKIMGELSNENTDWQSVTINTCKLGLDVLFMTSKCVNPVFLGASVVYGVADYMTSDY